MVITKKNEIKIGIVGNGTMGLSLFQYLLEYDCSLVLICRKQENREAIQKKIEKTLAKKKKRGLLSSETYAELLQSFLITMDYDKLSDCNLVIETVIEELEVKQKVVQEIENVVQNNCVIATNTSSIPLRDIFTKCIGKDRCFGLHFFNPVKCTSHVELGVMKESSEEQFNFLLDIVKFMEKQPLITTGEGCFVMTRILNLTISFFFLLYQEHNLTLQELNELIREEVMMFGPVEVIDTTGLHIIMQCLHNINSKRDYQLNHNLYERLEQAYESGCDDKGYSQFEMEHLPVWNQLNKEERKAYKKNCVLRFHVVIMNEVAYILNHNIIEDEKFPNIVEEVLGLHKNATQLIKDMGQAAIHKVLEEEYRKYRYEVFQAEDLTCLLGKKVVEQQIFSESVEGH